jgi:hypothetical protein
VGIITDFVVAKVSDAEKLSKRYISHSQRWFHAKGMTMDKLACLLAALTQQLYDETTVSFATLAIGRDAGPAVYQVPTELITLLATLNRSDVSIVAKRWVELDCGMRTTETAEWFINGLLELCVLAVKQHKTVLLLEAL